MNVCASKRFGIFLAVGLVICSALRGGEINVEEVQDAINTQYGAHIDPGGWGNFSFFSPDATQVNLLLYSAANATKPVQIIPMKKRSTDWQVRIRGKGIDV